MATTDALKIGTIERFKIDSSTIAEIGFEDGLCVVQFKNGHIYAYAMSDVEFEAFAAAESKGAYFNQNIRGRFEGQKMTGACKDCQAAPLLIGSLCGCGGRVVPVLSKREAERLER